MESAKITAILTMLLSVLAQLDARWQTDYQQIHATASCYWRLADRIISIWTKIPVGYLYCTGNPRTDWGFKTALLTD